MAPLADNFLGLIFYLEEGDKTFLRNVCGLSGYKAVLFTLRLNYGPRLQGQDISFLLSVKTRLPFKGNPELFSQEQMGRGEKLTTPFHLVFMAWCLIC
jgi:hypothetical protein